VAQTPARRLLPLRILIARVVMDREKLFHIWLGLFFIQRLTPLTITAFMPRQFTTGRRQPLVLIAIPETAT